MEFQSAMDAVACAASIQKSIAARNAALPEEDRLRYRMGINMGEILIEEGDIFGDGVNIAALLQEVADPEGIAVSGAVHDLIAQASDLEFADLGAHKFKNIAQPIRVYHLGADASARPSNTAFRPFVDILTDQPAVVATGGCLCGEIRYEATQPPLGSMLCHCTICQRFSGAPVLGGTTFLTDALTFTTAPPKFYRSSAIAERGFCPTCGASIMYRGLLKQWTKWTMVFTASLDNPQDHPPTYHLGIESQMPWLDIRDDLPRTECKDSPSLVEAYRAVGQTVP